MKNHLQITTEGSSINRIWVWTQVATKWFNHNDRYVSNSIDATIKFLEECNPIIKNNGYVNVVVQPTYEESSADCLEQVYITVFGYRLETDAEYKRRLESLLFGMNLGRSNWEKKKLYYDANGDLKRLTELKEAIASIK